MLLIRRIHVARNSNRALTLKLVPCFRCSGSDLTIGLLIKLEGGGGYVVQSVVVVLQGNKNDGPPIVRKDQAWVVNRQTGTVCPLLRPKERDEFVKGELSKC